MSMSPRVKRCLTLAGLGTAVLGLGFSVVAVAAPGVLDGMYRAIGPGTVSDMGPAARLGAGIYGGLMAGWGTMLYLVGRDVAVERAAAVGLVTWFVVDSAASFAVGYPLNALSNAGFLALFTPVLFAGARRRGPAAA